MSSGSRFPQLPLGIALREAASFDNYVVGDNAEAVSALRQASSSGGDACIYLWGGPAVGKTHLLQAVCRSVTARDETAVYLPLNGFAEFSPSALQGLETLAAVCLDDIDAVSGATAWEEAVFHLYNRILDRGGRLIVTAATAPGGLTLRLADLRSRLAAAAVFHLQPLNDPQKMEAIRLRARGRGFDLPPEVVEFLFRHYRRDTVSLFALLDRLDRTSLSAGRRITVPFVRAIIRDTAEDR